MENLNSFQSWAIKTAHDKGFRCRAKANWVELMIDGEWREYMSCAGVVAAIENGAK